MHIVSNEEYDAAHDRTYIGTSHRAYDNHWILRIVTVILVKRLTAAVKVIRSKKKLYEEQRNLCQSNKSLLNISSNENEGYQRISTEITHNRTSKTTVDLLFVKN